MIGNEKFPAIILCIQMAEINSTKYQTSFLWKKWIWAHAHRFRRANLIQCLDMKISNS
jgi:hypothetical protein